jgi:hypothetical protein
MASFRGVEAMTQAATLIEVAGWTNEFNQKVALPTDNARKQDHG